MVSLLKRKLKQKKVLLDNTSFFKKITQKTIPLSLLSLLQLFKNNLY